MLILAEGGFSSGLLEEIKKRICDSVAAKKRTFLIVPEQQTVIAEAEMTDLLEPNAPLVFDATNFTRFTNTLFRELGGLAGEYSDNTKKLLFVWRALAESAPLIPSLKSEISAGIAQKYLSAINEMQLFGISENELSLALSSDEISKNARLKEKLSSLSIVMGTYKRLLHERYQDSLEDIDAAIERLRANPTHLAGAQIFIDGFTSFTEGQYKLIGELSKRCTVTVSLNLPKNRSDAFEYTELALCASRILSVADLAGSEKKLLKFDGAFGKSHELLYEITRDLWRHNAKIDNNILQNDDIVRIFSARTPYEMCDFVCADIKRRVTEGARYSDFAIVASDAASYSGILDLSLRKYKLPAFTSYKRRLDSYAAVKLIFAAYSAIDSGFRREDVMAYAKCGFTELSRDELDELESYVIKWQIDRDRFLGEDDWHMSPFGYESHERNDSSEMLERVNAARRKLISPLSELKESVRDAKTVREHAVTLVGFLRKISLDKMIYERARVLYERGNYESAAEHSRLYGIISDALDTLVSAVGDFAATPSAFLAQLRLVLSMTEIGRIPSYVDEITVGSASMLRLYGKRHVYLIGVNEGEFPAVSKNLSYFADNDKRILALAGIKISSESEVNAARELFCFSRAISYASDSVTLLYTRTDASFGATNPSDVIRRIYDMTDGKIAPKEISELPVCQRIYTPDVGIEHLGELCGESYASLREALIDEGYGHLVSIGESRIDNGEMQLSDELTEEEYSTLTLTQTKLDSFVLCPLGYFCKYNLRLSDDSPAEFNAASIGSFIHAILENFFRELKRRGASVAELDEQQRRDITERAARDYLSTIEDGINEGGERMKIRIKRLCRAAAPVVDGLCDEFSDSSFVPTFFELRISDSDDALPSLPTIVSPDGFETKIKGIIDRVDAYKSGSDVYVRVVDYKTGSKDFVPENLEKGENLQMFLYLKALVDADSQKFKDALGVENGGEIKPAGVIYVSAAVGDTAVKKYSDKEAEDAVKKMQKRQGMILDDPEIINAMNTKFLPITFKDGEIDESSRRFMFDEYGYEEIMNTLENTVAAISDRIRSGEIHAMPKKDSSKKSPCEWCEFKPICRKKAYG